MGHHLKFLGNLLIVAVLLTFVACSHPDETRKDQGKVLFKSCATGSQVDDFTVDGASPHPKGITSDGIQNVWEVGYVSKAGSPDVAIVRGSAGFGAPKTWDRGDQSKGPKGSVQGAQNLAVAMIPSGSAIYVAQTYVEGPITSASIHYSVDSGATWKDAPFRLNAGANEKMTSIIVAPTGSVYFAGYSVEQNKSKTGFVGTLVDETATLLGKSKGEYKQLAADPVGNLYVAGTQDLGRGATGWLVIRGKLDQDKSLYKWSSLTADFLDDAAKLALGVPEPKGTVIEVTPDASLTPPVSPPPPPTILGSVSAMIYAKDDVLYVAGKVDGKGGSPWVVKRSFNTGNTFEDADVFKAPHYLKYGVKNLYDFGKSPIAVGGGVDSDDASFWNIRYALTARMPWTNLVSYRLSQDPNNEAFAVGAAGTFNYNELVVVGEVHDKDGLHHWLTVKEDPCAPPRK